MTTRDQDRFDFDLPINFTVERENDGVEFFFSFSLEEDPRADDTLVLTVEGSLETDGIDGAWSFSESLSTTAGPF